MTTFTEFAEAVHSNYNSLAKGELFVTDVEDLFSVYLAAFPAGSNPLFRVRTEHDCNCCKQFVNRLGKLVGFVNGKRCSVWDGLELEGTYDAVAQRLSEAVLGAKIVTVFRTREREYGKSHNFDLTGHRWNHLHGKVGDKHYSSDPATRRGEIEAVAQVFGRGLRELKVSDFDTVIELINANGLYRGEEHFAALTGFKELLERFDGDDGFVWANIANRHARFRNTVIGTLLVDLAAGVELDAAVRSFETKVAPQNYKRPTAVVTAKMVEQAVDKLKELGLEGAVHRRFARAADVSVNNVLFVDRSVGLKDRGGLVGLLTPAVSRVVIGTPITIEKFVTDVLPTVTGLEVLPERKHAGNFVSLTGGDGSERLFKWDNNFAWSYSGEVTDSVKQRVKAAGGKVDSLMRVSLSWSNYDDLDLHCTTPDGKHIYYADKRGILDVDMNAGGRRQSRTPVENLAFNRVIDGVYRVEVNNYVKVENVDVGFELEVEFGGVVSQYSYTGAVRDKETVEALDLVVEKGVLVNIVAGRSVVGGSGGRDKWGVTSGVLTGVTMMLNSPNYWDGQGVGARHWFFMLDQCRNPDPVRGIYNEFLRGDLAAYGKVFEILGAKTKCLPDGEQLSGLGFTAARGDSVNVVVNGGRGYNISF